MRLQEAAHEIDRLLVTANSEYHMCGNYCVRVRNLASGDWIHGHQAIGRKLLASLTVTPDSSWSVKCGSVEIGHRLYFASDTLTSPLCRVVRTLMRTAEVALPLAA